MPKKDLGNLKDFARGNLQSVKFSDAPPGERRAKTLADGGTARLPSVKISDTRQSPPPSVRAGASATPPVGVVRSGCGGERRIEIADQILGRFETDGQAHDIGSGAGRRALVVGKLSMRGRCRVQDQAAGVADIGEV